jgi:hypothetical protein
MLLKIDVFNIHPIYCQPEIFYWFTMLTNEIKPNLTISIIYYIDILSKIKYFISRYIAFHYLVRLFSIPWKDYLFE